MGNVMCQLIKAKKQSMVKCSIYSVHLVSAIYGYQIGYCPTTMLRSVQGSLCRILEGFGQK